MPPEKPELHPRNLHRMGYDFVQLVRSSPALAKFVRPNPYGNASVDFANPDAVKALNQALLRHFYQVERWDVPAGYLCPPIPGRADYLHYLADLLAEDHGGQVPHGPQVRALDVGTGANLIYPLLGARAYGWRFVGSEVDVAALRHAQQMLAANPGLAASIELRHQAQPGRILAGLLRPDDRFDLTLCNPPFYASAAEAAASTGRKVRNLGGRSAGAPVRNFGGRPTELWCPGGEAAFIRTLVAESAAQPQASRWFTTLVSQKTTLPGVYAALRHAAATEVRTVEMAQGQKISRFVAWTFHQPATPKVGR